MARRDVRRKGQRSPAAPTSGAAAPPSPSRPAAVTGARTARTTGSSRAAPRRSATGRRAKPAATTVAWDWIRTLVGAFAIYFFVQAFLVQAFRIPSGSMEDTLLIGDWLFVNKALYGPKIPLTDVHLPSISEPRRGGIVVFESPIEPGLNLVKRVIGVAGDTLAMEGARLRRNGVFVDEPYVQHTNPSGNAADPGMSWQLRHLVGKGIDPRRYRPTRDDWGPVLVPPGHFFMMGDNRDASFDSRYYGFVPRRLIKGKPLFIYYSYNPRSPDPLPFLTAIRWDRIGNPIR